MKIRHWMYKLSGKAMNIMAAMALMVTAGAMNRSCMWFFGQDKIPSGAEKLRRF